MQGTSGLASYQAARKQAAARQASAAGGAQPTPRAPGKMKGLSAGAFDVDSTPSSSKRATPAAAAVVPPKMKGLSASALDGPSSAGSPSSSSSDSASRPAPSSPPAGAPSVRPKMRFGVGAMEGGNAGNAGQPSGPKSSTKPSTPQSGAGRDLESSGGGGLLGALTGKLGALFSNSKGSEPRPNADDAPTLQQEDGGSSNSSSSSSSSREGNEGCPREASFVEGEQASSSGSNRDVSARALPTHSNAARFSGGMCAITSSSSSSSGSGSSMSSWNGSFQKSASRSQQVQYRLTARNVRTRVLCGPHPVSQRGQCLHAWRPGRSLDVSAPSLRCARVGRVQAHWHGCRSPSATIRFR
ncbi:hypothetical protein DUNSADRAFT_17146 [Dunaliella salina]|uniref:Encoded protein n=1 Tax=Dunaliella salina TaxID=3046 RepID=A0ABQ7H0D2_DUNSA|nr:hypothetical protein DUNSADRAFT_17146 [Dunaliella salina]|eukprot:KAF5840302.1 hypothetical protein DUNSADRAFT_17146 [Dunaliella salina]